MEHSEAWALSSKVNMLERDDLINLIGYYQEQTRGTIELKKRMAESVAMLHDLIDGGEQCRGMDSAISAVIRKLEGR